MAIPLIMDTDAGVDDALALIFALRSPEVEVKAITTVAGNVEVERCTANVLRVIDLLGVSRAPLVAQGARRPLSRPLVTAQEVHGKDGLGGNRTARIDKRRLSRTPAFELILETCDRFARRLVIVALGPLTNLALALRESSETLRKAGRIVSMGGAFGVPGNTGPVAEFNYFVDPEAAHEVLNAGLPLTVVPLDVTEQVILLRRDVVRGARLVPNGVSRFVRRVTGAYMRYHRSSRGFDGGYLHDPVAVAAAMKPEMLRTQRLHVDVGVSDTSMRGMSVATGGSGRIPRVDVGWELDCEGFLSMFFSRLWTAG